MNVRKNIKLVFILSLVFSVCYFLISSGWIDYEFFVETEFLFTFLGVFIGFSITLYTYITSIFDRIKTKISENFKNEIDRTKKRQLLISVHSEMRDDINFIIGGLIVVIFLTLGEGVIGILSYFYPFVSAVISAILLTIFTLTIVAIWDLIRVAFVFSDFLAKSQDDDLYK